ncbi:hypothetical protein DW901_13950 [Firmicutes bacterium AM41-5BH]|nr:hypothetical protein DW901_13950 [Firmicutes bacterium AM41-5BH]
MWYINGRVVSLPLTDMRYINGWVVSLVLRRKARDFFHISTERTEQMKKTGFYIIKDKFFEDMTDPYLKVQIPLHRITDSASNGSAFPVVTEHFSASSDHAFL